MVIVILNVIILVTGFISRLNNVIIELEISKDVKVLEGILYSNDVYLVLVLSIKVVIEVKGKVVVIMNV